MIMEDKGSVSANAITWKDIEKRKSVLVAKKTVLEYAGYVKNLRREENLDEYV
jgi:hypothetical protein